MAKPKPIQISIPKPCSQNWNEMTPSGNGRFCNNCQHTVTDFTGWSDAALYEFLAKNRTEKVCGRLHKNQLLHPINAPLPNRTINKWLAGLGFTIILAGATDVNLYAKPPYVHAMQVNNANDADAPNDGFGNTGDDTLTVRGVVVDSMNRPLKGAEIFLTTNPYAMYEDRPGTLTKADGSFVVQMQKNTNDKTILLIVTSLEHEEMKIPINSGNMYVPFHIKLEKAIYELMGAIVFPTTEPSSKSKK
jgi:hypothetical protein